MLVGKLTSIWIANEYVRHIQVTSKETDYYCFKDEKAHLVVQLFENGNLLGNLHFK